MPLAVGDTVTIRKMDCGTGDVVLAWPGLVTELSCDVIAVQARFSPRSGQAVFVDGVPFEPGDVFTEYYFRERWYNVFHIADTQGTRKGWYCNVTRPPEVDADTISYIDLALDLFVHPDGSYSILDEDEFAVASAEVYSPLDVQQARDALDALIQLAVRGELPAPEP